MSFCNFTAGYKKNKYTEVENTFIQRFLSDADGMAVKVYMYGLFLCQNPQYQLQPHELAGELSISFEELIDFFQYWEDFGAVNILSASPLNVEFLPLEQSYKSKRVDSNKYGQFTKEVQSILSGRMLTPTEFNEYFNFLENFDFKPEAMLLVIKYCVELKGDKIGYKYITTVLKDFAFRGITTFDKVERELSDFALQTSDISRIFHALGTKKQPDVDDQALLNKWIKEYGFDIEVIVFTAGKLKRYSMKKLDKFIQELFIHKKFSKEEILAYIEDKNKIKDLAYEISKTFYAENVPISPIIENYVSPWLYKGYSEASLKFISTYCFKKGKRSLDEMNGIIESLYKKGIVDFDSIADFFKKLADDDKFINEIFNNVGINRRVNNWDRENLVTWRKWNFSDDMIIEAAKRSAGTASPLPYMNAILSRWKNSEIYTVDSIKDSMVKDFRKSPVRFENERKYTQKELDDMIDNIDDIIL